MSLMSLDAFLIQLVGITEAIDHEIKSGLEEAAKIVKTEAKDELGTYQPAAGPTKAWAPLAPATQERRGQLGYPPNEPLLRDGTLRDSIDYTVGEMEAVIGSNLDYAAAQELGTDRIPPRSFLQGAAYRKTDEILDAIAAPVVMRIAGKRK